MIWETFVFEMIRIEEERTIKRNIQTKHCIKKHKKHTIHFYHIIQVNFDEISQSFDFLEGLL